jgi:ankyrin repeat protein|tara:strand:- start:282 stop:695 length:414 start_codon:yes stop_codon:yes gene_type:complete
LLHSKTDPDLTTEGHATPLGVACEKGNEKMAQLLMSNGNVDPNLASKNGEPHVVDALLANTRTEANKLFSGLTPLHIACEQDHIWVVENLLKSEKVDPNAVMRDKSTALHIACKKGYERCVAELLAHKDISTNLKDN